MYRLNDPNFDFYGQPRRSFGKIVGKVNRLNSLNNTSAKPQRFSVDVYEPEQDWQPFRLINDKLKLAYTINQKMGWTEITREVLRDGTPPSSVCALVKGRYKTANGWRCEHL